MGWRCSAQLWERRRGERGPAARKEGSRTGQQTRGEKPGLAEAWPLCLSREEGLWWGGESRGPGGQLSEVPLPCSSAQAGKGSGEGALSPGDPLYCQLLAAEIAPF